MCEDVWLPTDRMWEEAVALLEEMEAAGRAVEERHVGVVLSACLAAGRHALLSEDKNKVVR
jgi:hypothetical protein